jgi:hypothetical protein
VGKLVVNLFVNFHNKWYQSYSCGEMQSLKFGIERLDGVRRYCSLMEYGALFMCRGTVHGRSTEHCSRAEVLFMEDYSWSTVYRCCRLVEDTGLDKGVGPGDLLCRLL